MIIHFKLFGNIIDFTPLGKILVGINELGCPTTTSPPKGADPLGKLLCTTLEIQRKKRENEKKGSFFIIM